MDGTCAPGGSLFWILLAVNAFGGNFVIEEPSDGEWGFGNYSEAGHHAPAFPEVPTPPNPSLATLASFQKSADTKLSEGALVSQLITSLSAAQLGRSASVANVATANTLSDSSLATIVQNARREVYSESRLAYMKRATEGHKVRCSQLASLLGLLTFSDDRLALIKGLGSQVVDSENYPSLYRYFPFESDRAALTDSF